MTPEELLAASRAAREASLALDTLSVHLKRLSESVSPLEAPVTPVSSPPKPAETPVPPSTQALSLAQTPGGDTDAVERCADCGWWPAWGAHACDFRQRAAAESPELSRRERGFDPELARRAAERTIP